LLNHFAKCSIPVWFLGRFVVTTATATVMAKVVRTFTIAATKNQVFISITTTTIAAWLQ